MVVSINHQFSCRENPSLVWHYPFISKLRAVTEPQEPGNAIPRIVSHINTTPPWWSFGKTPTLKKQKTSIPTCGGSPPLFLLSCFIFTHPNAAVSQCVCRVNCWETGRMGGRWQGSSVPSQKHKGLDQEPDESLSTNVLGSDHDCKCVEMMSFFSLISTASGPKGVFHRWRQYYDAAWLIT